MSRTLYLEPRQALPLPMIVSHQEWCLWLSAHGCLAAGHGACLHAERCVAHETPVAAWRSNKHP